MDATASSVLLAGLLTGVAVRRGALPVEQAPFITPILSGLFMWLVNRCQQIELNGWSIGSVDPWAPTIVIAVGAALYFWQRMIGQRRKCSPMESGIGVERTDRIFVARDLDLWNRYVNHPDARSMFETPSEFEYGDKHLLAVSYAISLAGISQTERIDEIQKRGCIFRPKMDRWIGFDDTHFGITGQYCWTSEVQEVQVASDKPMTKVTVPFVILRYSRKPGSKLQKSSHYLEEVKKWFDDKDKNRCTLMHYKIYISGGRSYHNTFSFYDGVKRPMADMERRFMDTFFQKDKQRLWDMIKLMHFDSDKIHKIGQFPQIGLLLHGPPGTGKSTFAYRIANTLGRHVMSIDLRMIKNKGALDRVITQPYPDGETTLTAKEVVFVFDEFDLVVKELMQRSKVNRHMLNHWEGQIESFTKSNPATVGDGKMTDKLKRFDFEGNEEVQIQDLLSALSGVVPTEGAIFIATTNHFEEIRTLCPALFREQRLTPVKFDFYDLNTLQEVAQHFFGQHLTHPAIVRNFKPICPAKVVEILLEVLTLSPTKQLTQDLFGQFQTRLAQCMDENKSDKLDTSSQTDTKYPPSTTENNANPIRTDANDRCTHASGSIGADLDAVKFHPPLQDLLKMGHLVDLVFEFVGKINVDT